jgi:hypothetical protein
MSEEVKEASEALFEYFKADKVVALIVLHDIAVDAKELMVSANGSEEDKVMGSFTLGAIDENLELLKDIITYANAFEVNDLLAYIPDLDKTLLNTVKELAEIYSDIKTGKSLGGLWSRLSDLHGDLYVTLGAFIKNLIEEVKELRAELQKVQGSAAQGSSA